MKKRGKKKGCVYAACCSSGKTAAYNKLYVAVFQEPQHITICFFRKKNAPYSILFVMLRTVSFMLRIVNKTHENKLLLFIFHFRILQNKLLCSLLFFKTHEKMLLVFHHCSSSTTFLFHHCSSKPFETFKHLFLFIFKTHKIKV